LRFFCVPTLVSLAFPPLVTLFFGGGRARFLIWISVFHFQAVMLLRVPVFFFRRCLFFFLKFFESPPTGPLSKFLEHRLTPFFFLCVGPVSFAPCYLAIFFFFRIADVSSSLDRPIRDLPQVSRVTLTFFLLDGRPESPRLAIFSLRGLQTERTFSWTDNFFFFF